MATQRCNVKIIEVKMKRDICPLCATPSSLCDDKIYLKNIIYKHLHISIKEKYLNNICGECERTIIYWDNFAAKCWCTQNLFENNPEYQIDDVKLEERNNFAIKVEKTTEQYSNDDNFDEKYSYYCDIKIEDPLTDIKSEKNTDRKRKKFSKRRLKKIIEKNNVKSSTRKKSSFLEYSCHICSARMKTWTSLKMHCSDEHSEKPQVLCVCGKYLNTARTIQRHKILHDDKQGHKCEHCDKKYVTSEELKEHILLCHTSQEEYNFHCTKCPKKFCTSRLLKLHLARHLSQDIEQKYTCDVCGAVLASKCGLKVHKLALHENVKNHICDICGYSFTTKGSLEAHILVHADTSDFRCDKCQKRFKSMALLKTHIDTHDESIYKCPQCPAVLRSPDGLRKHKIVHSDVLKYSCNVCNKKFKRSQHLKVHINSHYGIKPSKCQWCPKAFSNNQNLKLHIKHVHIKESQKYNLSEATKVPIDTNSENG